MRIKCQKCGHVNKNAAGKAGERCPLCSAAYPTAPTATSAPAPKTASSKKPFPLVLVLLALVTIGLGGMFGWQAYQRSQSAASAAALDGIAKELVDAIKLAEATPRIALAGPITKLQQLKQQTSTAPTTECTAEPSKQMAASIDSYVAGMLIFMANKDHDSAGLAPAHHRQRSLEQFKNYQDGIAKCRAKT